MALNLDAETERLARELARATGESLTVATRTALQERLAALHATEPLAELRESLDVAGGVPLSTNGRMS